MHAHTHINAERMLPSAHQSKPMCTRGNLFGHGSIRVSRTVWLLHANGKQWSAPLLICNVSEHFVQYMHVLTCVYAYAFIYLYMYLLITNRHLHVICNSTYVMLIYSVLLYMYVLPNHTCMAFCYNASLHNACTIHFWQSLVP